MNNQGLTLKTLIAIAVVMGMALGSPAVFGSTATYSEPLFTDAVAAASSVRDAADEPQVIRSRLVNVDFHRLCRLETGNTSQAGDAAEHTLELNLFGDVYLTAQIHRVDKTFSGGFSCTGHIEGIPGSEAVIVVTGDIVSANISTPDHFYQVRYVSGGTHQVRELDQSRFPSELPGVPVELDREEAPASQDLAAPADSAAYVEILVVYTATARSGAGGTSAIENLIDLAIAETNTGYGNSGVSQRLRLVHTAEVDYSESSFNWSTTLTRLRQTSDGYMDDVHTLRDAYGADEVVLIVNNSASCGIGYVMQTVTTAFAPYAFAVVARNCATGYYSFAHELGHNMGCAHDRANAGVAGAYNYSYGYQAPDEAFRTIMSYNCPGNCTRVNYWSNPDKTYGGQDMGVLYTDPSAADNRRTLNNTASAVANFRQSGGNPSITVTSPDGGESLNAGGTHTITWTSAGTVGNVKIQYFNENYPGGVTIVSSTANDGSYNWTVPNDPSTSCGIRVSEASDGNPEDYSDGFFAIVSASNPTITVTTPNGGEVWPVGSSQTINWTSTGTVGNVKIEYSTDTGSNWTTVAASTANDGVYNWTIPNTISTQCAVKISEASDSSPSDISNSFFSIESASNPTITVSTPNGGEGWSIGSSKTITWTTTGTVGNVKIQYSTNNGSSWSTVTSSTANDGAFNWTVPDAESSRCRVKISEASDGDPSDTSNAMFSITSPSSPSAPTLTIVSPNGGENLEAGGTHTITWTSTGTVGKVKLQYSSDNGSNWLTVVSSTGNDGSYSWTLPNVDSSKCKVKISEASDGDPSDTSNSKFTIYIPSPPEITISRDKFRFGADTGGNTTSGQTVLIGNSGGGTLSWTASTDASWLAVSPASGNGDGVLSVTVDASGLTTGTYTGNVSVADDDADNSPQTIAVTLKVHAHRTTSEPFGDFSTPAHGSVVRSSIPVTGWVADDIEAVKVEIFNGANYVGDAVFVEGARPDVEQAYADYPKNHLAGWGYMLLTYYLPNGGNGTYTLYAKATDAEGNQVTLGSKTITCDNANAVKPFGSIDTPSQGGVAFGGSFINWGWALTPQPNKIPENGSTIKVYVDGVNLGSPTYNVYREDIARLFPGYANTDGAVGYLYLDTTAYENGIHSIQWTATDDGGNTDGIGSRYFSIQNTGSSDTSNDARIPSRDRVPGTTGRGRLIPVPANLSGKHISFNDLHVDDYSPVRFRKGYNTTTPPEEIYPGEKGCINIDIRELDRIVVHLDGYEQESGAAWQGFQVIGNGAAALPIGSTLDREKGIFYWQASHGFYGQYRLVFIDTIKNVKRKINITIGTSN